MTKRQNSNRNRQPQTNTPPPINIGDTETNYSVQQAERAYNSTNNITSQPKVFKSIIAWIRNDKNQSKISNIISIAMFVATFGLLQYTIFLYDNASDNLKTIKEQFDASNKPYIDIDKVILSPFGLDSIPNLQFDIVNIGKTPVQMVDIKWCHVYGGERIDTARVFYELENANLINWLTSKQTAFNDKKIHFGTYLDKITSKERLDSLESAKLFYYIYVKFSYIYKAKQIDTVNAKYIFRIRTPPMTSIIFLKNTGQSF